MRGVFKISKYVIPTNNILIGSNAMSLHILLFFIEIANEINSGPHVTINDITR